MLLFKSQYVQSCVLDLHCVYFYYTMLQIKYKYIKKKHYFTILTFIVPDSQTLLTDGSLWETLFLSGVNH